jgi:hypothetical protein
MTPKRPLSVSSRDSTRLRGGEYTRPGAISGFSQQPEKYQKAVNELLSAHLVSSHKDNEDHVAIGLNEQCLKEVKRELRPIWAYPAVWVVVVLAIALTAFSTSIV